MRELAADELSREDDGGLRVVGGGTSRVFLHVERDAEEDDGFETFGDEGGEEGGEFVESPTLLTGEGDDVDLCRGCGFVVSKSSFKQSERNPRERRRRLERDEEEEEGGKDGPLRRARR